MNLVFTVSGYLLPGGVQIVTQYLCEGLVDRGHKVTVLTNAVEGYADIEEVNGVHILRFKEKDIFKIHTGEKRRFQAYLLSIIDNIDCVITVCAQSFASEWVWQIFNNIQCKKILYMHGMREEKIKWYKIHGIKQAIKEIILVPWWRLYFKRNWKYIVKYDNAIHLFKNDSSYNYFIKHGYNKNKVIMNSCDELFFSETNDELFLNKYALTEKYYICVANYDDNKNQLSILDAFLNAKLNNSMLVFVGSKKNDYATRLLQQVKDRGSNRVKVLIGIDRKETISLIKNAYALILNSKSEYFPLTIVEGMASGKPFISSDVGIVSMLPGGNITHCQTELEYWLNYYDNNPLYVNRLGAVAHDFAINNLRKSEIIEQMECIIRDN